MAEAADPEAPSQQHWSLFWTFQNCFPKLCFQSELTQLSPPTERGSVVELVDCPGHYYVKTASLRIMFSTTCTFELLYFEHIDTYYCPPYRPRAYFRNRLYNRNFSEPLGGILVNLSLPVVSVIINNYNYGRFLAEAAQSVVAQTYKNIECVIVDDASTDDSAAILAEIERDHPTIRIIRRNVTVGSGGHFSTVSGIHPALMSLRSIQTTSCCRAALKSISGRIWSFAAPWVSLRGTASTGRRPNCHDNKLGPQLVCAINARAHTSGFR